MARKKKAAGVIASPEALAPHIPVDNGWVTSDRFTLANGKELAPGANLMIQGERGGRFKFLSHVRRPDGVEWLNVIGGSTGVKMFRSFRPDRVSRVLKTRFA